MARRRLIWKLYATYLGVVGFCAAAGGWYATHPARKFFTGRVAGELEEKARMAAVFAGEVSERDGEDRLAELARSIGAAASTRVTFIRPDGTVIGDSEVSPETMANHGGRPEVRAAMEGGTGRDIRRSSTTGWDTMYVAVPLRRGGETRLVIRTASHLREADEAIGTIRMRIAAGSLAAAVLAALPALLVARRAASAIREVGSAAGRFAAGDFSRGVPRSDIEELDALADALNSMAGQLDAKIAALDRERKERDAILSSMAEGVLAIDSSEQVLWINDAARDLLGMREEIGKRTLCEVAREADAAKFAAKALATDGPVEGDLIFRGGQERVFRARATPLRDAAGRKIGVVVVLNDITRLRRLETVRRDFVANVSHELKTPITAIKASIETLRDGAVSDPGRAARFLDIAARQADRLGAIVNDLLLLARLERETDVPVISPADHSVADVLRAAAQDCEAKAEEKGIKVSIACDENLTARFDRGLIEQAVANLLDNAIKYSDPGKEVRIEAERRGEEVAIRVRDEGKGIEARHLPRLFERFYRADEARSREMGGTGLGLSIVKHIALAHKGRVDVSSSPGKGSTFSIYLPLRP
ncbi:MAG: ATP-binding protein [Planctomycetota bacterium]|nr:ATP-binding protein [Planctomycetota bacterium]